jgi:Septum formation initiator
VPAAEKKPRRRRRSRGVYVRRWLGVGALCLVALLYYRPLRTYLETRHALGARALEVRALRSERRDLERRLAESATDSALLREARKLGFVKPGERLFIVTGTEAWKRLQRTITGHGG